MKFFKKYNYILLIISILFFVLACSQKIYCTDNDCAKKWSGLSALVYGVFGIFSGGIYMSWLANPLILISWLTFKNTKISLITSSLALILGLNFLLYNEILINEGGFKAEITGYKIGFFLWNLSFVVMILANLVAIKYKASKNR